jgi:hypothetical protein
MGFGAWILEFVGHLVLGFWILVELVPPPSIVFTDGSSSEVMEPAV